jgi:pimeloyl-ACP methyl ester carboxylesterase
MAKKPEKKSSKRGAVRFSVEDSNFHSRGMRCAGRLYRPKDISKPPIVVMAHGFAAEMAFGLPAFAERFASKGMAVFLFDYRCFGESDGEPRNLVSPSRHLQDWKEAIAHVRNLSGINKDRIALWGSSFSGGHVIVTAAEDHNIAAIVAQVPFVDGVSTLQKTGFVHSLIAMGAYLRDLFRIITFRPPYYIPVVGRPDTFALMNTPDSYPGYMSLVPEGSPWRNECPARIALPILFYRPISYAKRVRCPALLLSAENDSLISSDAVVKTASAMSKSSLVTLPVGHFDVYTGDVFEKVIALESDFLEASLK